jgi:hypothetical protein
MAPLYTLIAANLLLAPLGVVLALVAVGTLFRRHGVLCVRERLGLAGLVAQLLEGGRNRDEGGFGGVEGLFAENHGISGGKAGIVAGEGGLAELVSLMETTGEWNNDGSKSGTGN